MRKKLLAIFALVIAFIFTVSCGQVKASNEVDSYKDKGYTKYEIIYSDYSGQAVRKEFIAKLTYINSGKHVEYKVYKSSDRVYVNSGNIVYYYNNDEVAEVFNNGIILRVE